MTTDLTKAVKSCYQIRSKIRTRYQTFGAGLLTALLIMSISFMPSERGFAANTLSTFDPGYCSGEEFSYTGNDELLTPTPGSTHMKVKVWGAGGGRDGGSKGGAGGYVEAEVPIVSGTTYRAVVGAIGSSSADSYAFQGAPWTASNSGGGLSGLFTGTSAITATDQAKAILVAGGGGSGEQTAGQGIKIHYGGHGGDPVYSGGEPTMKGQDGYNDNGTAVPSAGGSGAGYEGGQAHKRGGPADSTGPTENYGGGGGSSYVNPALITTGTDQNLYTTEWTDPPVAPNDTDIHYVAKTGQGNASGGYGGSGLVVVQYACVAPPPEWLVSGGTTVDEGACTSYTVSMTSAFDTVATVDLSTMDVTTTSTDYTNLNTAVTAAVAAYAGPGTLSWDGTTLTFDGGGTAKMDDLTFSLCATTDTTAEGTESYDVALTNPTVMSCVMPEMLMRARVNGGNNATSMNYIDNVVTNFGSNGTSTTWTDQGAAVYSYSGGVLTNTTGQNSAYAYSDNTLPVNEDGYIEFTLSNPLPALTQLDVGLGNITYPVSGYFIVDINTAAGWRTNGNMPGYIGLSDGNDPSGSTAWQPGTAAGDLYRVSREGCDMKWYRNGTEIRNLTRISSSSPGAISSGADKVSTSITEPLDTDTDGVPDNIDIDDDNDGIIDTVESPSALGAITSGDNTPNASGSFTNNLGVNMPFSLTGSDPTLNFISTMPGVTEGLQFRWVEPNTLPSFDVDLTLSTPVNGILRSVRVGDAAPGNTQTFANGNKDVTLSWPGSGSGVLSDPNGDITSHADGAVVASGVVLTVAGGSIFDSVWSLDIDLTGVTPPVVISYDSVNFALAKGNEGFSFIPFVDTDTDADTISNRLDLDSDNDGISDFAESGFATLTDDANSDGTVALAESADADTDGLMDNFTAVTGTTPANTEADATPDYLDLDSDGDGLPDTIEARPSTAYAVNDGNVSDDDADGDGIVSLFDGNDTGTGLFGGDHPNFNAPVNTDSDAAADYTDLDSDDDGDADSVEGGTAVTTAPSYSDPDGSVDDPLSATIGELLDNNDADTAEVDYRSDDYAPVATADSGTTAADTNATVALADNVTDVNNNQDLTTIDLDPSTPGIDSTLTTADGVWSVDSAGVVTFDPASAFEGTATISYAVADSDGYVSAPANVSVTVDGADPVVTVATATTAADTNVTVPLAGNVSDANNDVDITTIDLDPSTPGIDSTVTTADGVWSVDAAGVVTFDPAPAFQGTATAPYTVQDDDGNVSAAANISVTVAGATPVATTDSATTAADTNVTVALADNVSDANNDVDITTIDLDPSTPGIDNTVTTADGVWSVDAAGVVTFDPASSFEGTATIPYAVSDAAGNVSTASNVSVTVAGATPVATVATAATSADTNVTVPLAGNVSDANNDVDITTIDLDPSTPGIDNTVTTADGVWSVDAAGVVTFDPALSFEGTATIPYAVSDAAGNVSTASSVSVTVAGATPVATVATAATSADTNATVPLAGNVSDANNDVDITTIDLDPSTPGIDNTVTTADGVWSVDAAGVVTFDPVSSFEGTATVPYAVSDAAGNVSIASNVSVTVGGATPVASTATAMTAADTNATVPLAGNVSDANNDVDVSTIDLDPSTPGIDNTITTADGVWSVDAAGVVTFDPASSFEGTATIPYAVSDTAGNVSTASSVSVTVGGATPVATAATATTAADTNATIPLAGNVSDANNDVDVSTIDLDPLTPGIDNTLTTADGVWSVDAAGVVRFDPGPAFEGTATVPYTVQDDDGNVSASANISVTVSGATPVATAATATTAADTNVTVPLAGNVSDANNDVDIASIDLDPSTPGIDSTVTTADGVWTVDAVGVVTFDPAPAFEGTASAPYTVSDDDGNVSAPANISVTVGGATPVVTADSATTLADTNATVALADNASDANNDVDITTIDLDPSTPGVDNTLTTADGTWSVDPAGVVTFDPAPGFEGTASIPYTVQDDDGNVSAPANVSVTVGGATPVVTADSTTVTADTIATVDLSDNATDANNDVALNTLDLDPSTPGIQNTLTTADGVWSVNAAGMVSFDPASNFEGTATIPYTVSDDDGNVAAPSSVSVTVGGATPIATNDSAAVLAGVTASVNLADNISDANNDELVNTIDLDPSTPGIDSTVATADGVWSIDPAGMLTFVPAPGFQGTTTLAYTVSDDDGNVSTPATVNISVGSAAPIADADTETTVQGANVVIDVLDGDVDANNDIDTTSIDLDPATPGVQSTFTVAGEGTYSVVAGQVVFDPDPAFTGASTIDYTVSDAAGNVSNVAMASVDVLLDSDGDGIADVNDLDDDNDGLPDLMEGTGDTDGDGIPDSLDLDSDNDGLTDATEAGGSDSDGDGIIDGFTDTDGDGLDDATATTPLPVADTDGDGNANYVDVDSDNDGMTDTAEAGGPDADGDGVVDGFTDADGDGLDDTVVTTPITGSDNDNDGVADHLDIDSDNDGISDATEAGAIDADGDGQVDGFIDADGDGLDDSVASIPLNGGVDTDNDGVADHLDLDADNDGITDAIEAGGADADADGILDGFTDADGNGMDDSADAQPLPVADTDGDGVADFQELDSDNDSIPDSVEAGPTGSPVDTDGNGTADYLDSDSDGDGIPDSVEAGTTPASPEDTDSDGTPDYLEQDSDADGIPDSIEAGATPGTPVDTDSDGTPDFLEPDSDNDGIPDSLEGVSDSDGDGTPDYLDSDSDGDGIPDSVEAGATPATPEDTDGDGTPDFLEQDSDADGIPDSIEAGATPASPADTDGDGAPDFLEQDSDSDGIPDSVEAGATPTTPADTDSDGTPDFLESDSDNDGIPDSLEGVTDTDGDGTPDYLDSDSDGDGIPDSVEAGATPAAPADTDGDGTPDFLEQDSDADGIPDSVEAGASPITPTDTDGDGTPDFLEQDSDADGIPDNAEAGASPATPVDTDGDGSPDFQEPDSDNDGIPDSLEGVVDTDGDGSPDYLDSDSDGDGIPDSIEAGANPATPDDTDGDGTADYLDLDSDSDGVTDDAEAGANPANPVDTDGDGTPDYQEAGSDSDSDGIPDLIEGTGDTDNDGTPDYLDTDSDDDGIPDSIETAIDTDTDGLSDYLDVDADNDGISDAVELAADTDADGVSDFRDLDVDNDGIYDLIEARIGQVDVVQIDTDNDGVVDISNPYGSNGMADIVEVTPDSGDENYQIPDIDGDGVLDFRDLDTDNDGLLDTHESDHIDQNINGLLDTVGSVRRTVLVVNANGLAADAGGLPRNTDNDGLADFRDGDSDNDGIMDIVESFGPTLDADNDGMLDDFADANNDGVDDLWLSAPVAPADTDGDGIADAQEIDADGDGITDLIESGGVDADGDGTIDFFDDADGDGIDDTVATVPGLYIDTDGDGAPDFQDFDSDNDGLIDLIEAGGVDADGDGEADTLAIGTALPDTNGNGIPDVLEIPVGATVIEPEPTPAAATGTILTGLRGSGCSIQTSLSVNDGAQKIDPMLALLGLLAGLGIALRRSSRRLLKQQLP